MSLTVVITPFTVTVATAVLDDDQLKFPLPPVACHKHREIGVITCTTMTPLSGKMTRNINLKFYE